MDLKPTKPLSGFIELLPVQQRCFDECANRIQKVLKTAGFSHLGLPAIERAEVLTDKDNWDEITTQMYLFQKGDTKMGLRYDGTVGLARYVAGHKNDIVFPFRAYQFARNYRAERRQRGRFREFYQIDLDILGQNDLSINYDAEIVAVLSNAYKSLEKYIGPATVKVGYRKFWNAMFEMCGLNPEQSRAAFILIDKKDKLDDFAAVLSDEIGVENSNVINQVFTNGYKSFVNQNDKLDLAISELDDFVESLDAMGIKNVEIDMGIMRGHAYYTGIVFEFFLEQHPDLGAVGGGGRYDDLASKFSNTKIVGVGAAMGFSRLMVTLLQDDKIDLAEFETPIDAAVLIMGEGAKNYAVSVLSKLRNENIAAVPYLDTNKKFKNQIEFADKINTKFSVIIGEDEVNNKTVSLKNMSTGNQETLSIDAMIKTILGK